MGRPLADIDNVKMALMAQEGYNQKDIAEELGVSIPTLEKRLSEIKEKQGILLKYRQLQSLQLTSIQARVLEAITPEKINEAPLKDLVMAFKILKDRELVMEGKPSEIQGLVGYLMEIEKEENRKALEGTSLLELEEVIDVVEALSAPIPSGASLAPQSVEDPDYMPDF